MRRGDELRFTNRNPAGLRVRVTTKGGTSVEVELHPGAELSIIVGEDTESVVLLPPAKEFTVIKAV